MQFQEKQDAIATLTLFAFVKGTVQSELIHLCLVKVLTNVFKTWNLSKKKIA